MAIRIFDFFVAKLTLECSDTSVKKLDIFRYFSFSFKSMPTRPSFPMFCVGTATFSPRITRIISGSSHARPMDVRVTWVSFGFGNLRQGYSWVTSRSLRLQRFYANNVLQNGATDTRLVSLCSARQDASNDMLYCLCLL